MAFARYFWVKQAQIFTPHKYLFECPRNKLWFVAKRCQDNSYFESMFLARLIFRCRKNISHTSFPKNSWFILKGAEYFLGTFNNLRRNFLIRSIKCSEALDYFKIMIWSNFHHFKFQHVYRSQMNLSIFFLEHKVFPSIKRYNIFENKLSLQNFL